MSVDGGNYKGPKFFASLFFSRAYRGPLRNLQTPHLKPLMEAYVANMDRVALTPVLLSESVFWTGALSRAAGPVPFVVGIPSDDVRSLKNEEWSKGFIARRDELFAKVKNMTPQEALEFSWTMGSNLIENVCGPTESHKREWEVGVKPEKMREGINSMYYSMILNSYAAFEALATDLWIESVNAKPKLYKQIKGDALAKSVSLKVLERHGFDVSKKMGQLLVDTEKVSFQRLEKIIEAYEYTFGNGAEGCTVFQNNEGIEKIEKVRHLIAHRSGKVDSDFKWQSRKWTEFADAPIGEHLPIDGELLCTLINYSVDTAVELMKFVDSKRLGNQE